MDSYVLSKMNLGARQLYQKVGRRAEHMRLRPTEAAPANECIPEDVAVLVRFTGDAEDLKAAGMVFADSLPHENKAFYEGSIDPVRLGQLAAIPHVESIELVPEAHSELQPSTIEYLSAEMGAGHEDSSPALSRRRLVGPQGGWAIPLAGPHAPRGPLALAAKPRHGRTS